MNVHLEVELSDIAFRVNEIRSLAKYVSDDIVKTDLLRIADDLEASESRIRAELDSH